MAALVLLAGCLIPAVASASRAPTGQERREIVAVSQHIQRAAGAEPKVGVSRLRLTNNDQWALGTVTLRFADGPPDSALAIYQRVHGRWIVTAHSPGTGYGIQCGIGMPQSAMRELGLGTSCSSTAAVRPAQAVAAGRQVPRLGRPWGHSQSGYGKVRPSLISNGGDPTGQVEHVHWTSWGASQAIGEGDAEYVWPGTDVASNRIAPGARVVAFHLGTCRGHRAYNAIEWYFPSYGETFDPNSYINICTGKYVEPPLPPETSCPDTPLADEAGTASEVKVFGITCAAADTVIGETNTAQFGTGEARFVQGGFRCGSEGSVAGLPPTYVCGMANEAFFYSVEA
jgi:hypothetical protein